MNEKLKFNIERLKRDFEDVIDELCRENRELQQEVDEGYSEAYVDDLHEELENVKDELAKVEEERDDLIDKVEELEKQLKQYRNEGD